MTTPATSGPPRVLTVIVNYRTADLVIEHFGALASEYETLPGSRVVIVDNHSPGTDAAKLQAFAEAPERRDWVEVIDSPDNNGFAAGNNLAIRPALSAPDAPDYVFILNPDAFVRPGALHELIRFMDSNPDVGMAGSRLEGADGAVQTSAFRYFSIPGEFESAAQTGPVSWFFSRWRVPLEPSPAPARVDWVCGAAVLIRREVFKDVGYFDEEYFLYYEETDFMRQAARRNWPTWYAPSSRVVHLMGQSSGVINGKLKSRLAPDYWHRSRSYYFRKNHGQAYAFAADLAWLAGALINYSRLKLAGKTDSSEWAAIRRFVKSQFGGGLPADGREGQS